MQRTYLKIAVVAWGIVGLAGVPIGAFAASGGVTETDGVLTFDTSDGDISYSQAFGANVQKVVKTGDGTLTLDTPSPDFPASSQVEVLQGTLKVRHADVFGLSAGVSRGLGAAITIKEGATLLLNIPTRANDTATTYPLFANHPITVGGVGVGGGGQSALSRRAAPSATAFWGR